MARPPFAGFGLLTYVTALLGAVLVVGGGALFFVVDRILEDQVTRDLERQADGWLSNLATGVEPFLWNVNLSGAAMLTESLAQSPLVGSLEVRDEHEALVFQRQTSGPVLATLTRAVRHGGQAIGRLRLTVSSATVRPRVADLEAPAFLAVAAFLLAVLLVTPLVLATTVLKPLRQLVHRLKTLDPHQPAATALVVASPVREFRLVGEALAGMAEGLGDLLQTLEARVEERTRSLAEAKDRLAHAEALATLGQLSAGIAHELNTPLAAVVSADRTLEAVVQPSVLKMLTRFLDPQVVADPGPWLDEVAVAARRLEPRLSMAARQALRSAWKASGRSPEDELLDLLSYPSLQPVAARLVTLPVGELDEVVRVTVLTARMLGVISTAGEQGAAVVQSLQGELQHQKGEPSAWFDGAAGLDRALALHANQWGRSVELRRSIPEGLRWRGPEHRLQQVWLNLVGNALQAVGTKGWVEVTARVDEGWAEVEVADSGPPVPANLRGRLFEPYFTTKSGGLGLGLHLSKAILESLGGRLLYQDGQGRKAFVARWPSI